MTIGKLSPIILAIMLAPAIARADLSSSQAKKLITKTAGMSLPSGSVRIVRKPVMMDANLAEAIAEIDLVFRMSRDSSGAWRIAEVRTGQEAWESLELIARAGGGHLAPPSCQIRNQFQQRVASDLSVRQARCLVAALFDVELPNDAVRVKSISG